MNPNQSLTKADRLEMAIDKGTTSELQINRAGQIAFSNANEIMEFAKMMALAKQAIPPHLRENPGGCLAVCIQASSWTMSPFAVANKSYVVNDRMAYESGIIAAVILMRAPIKGRIKYKYTGEGQTRSCTASVTCNDGEVVEYTSPELRNIKVQNSPLWKNDPDQQLAYYSARSLARRHFPDVILGVYTPEEMAQETLERDITPSFTKEPALPAPRPEPTHEQSSTGTPLPAAVTTVSTVPEAPAVGTSGAEEGGGDAPDDTDKATLLADLNKRMEKDGVSAKTVKAWAVANAGVASVGILTKEYSVEQLQAIDEAWDQISGNA